MKISASLMCADSLNLERDVKELELAEIDLWHVDIMDGVYVPNLAMNFASVKALKDISAVPIDVHLMVDRPENYVSLCAEAGVSQLSFHLDQVKFPHRLIAEIKGLGMGAGAAINPACGLESLSYVLDQVDYVLIMAVEPGFAGQKFIANTTAKIAKVKKLIDEQQLKLPIQVDGNINVDTAVKAFQAGAEIFVAGTSCVFTGRGSPGQNLRAFRRQVLAEIGKGGGGSE